MTDFSDDIYTEPQDVDFNTLSNLGPLAPLAGIWEGAKGVDVKPKVQGAVTQEYIERIEMQPIDPQTNGPQLYYGLRYNIFVTKPHNKKTYHEQVGYWLWEPATETVIQTVAIPRAQVALASGKAKADAKMFEVVAEKGLSTFGILSTPFLEYAFDTTEYRAMITVNDDLTWSYELTTVLMIKGQPAPFFHTDRNTLAKIGEPTPNPMAN